MIETSYIAPCVAYFGRAESEAARGQRMTGELETGIERPGSETVMAFVAEQVPGATSGAVLAVPGYFRRTREICDRHGGLPILDKGICGMGRTGTPFACDQDGIAPDIAAIAKGLRAGSQPVGAMLRTDCIHHAIEAGSGPFPHGHTRLAWDGPLARAQIMGERLEAALRSALGKPPMSAASAARTCFAASSVPKTTQAAPPSRPGAGPMPGSRPPLSRPACSAIRWAAALTGGWAIRFCWRRPSPLTALMLLKSRISCNSRWQPCGEPPRLPPCHQEALELRRILIFIQAENRKRAV